MVSNEELRQLQAELLAEEMKLALMKQVRQSQRDLHVMAAQQQAAAMVVQNQLVPSAQPLAFAQLQAQSAPVAQQSQNQLLLTAQQPAIRQEQLVAAQPLMSAAIAAPAVSASSAGAKNVIDLTTGSSQQVFVDKKTGRILPPPPPLKEIRHRQVQPLQQQTQTQTVTPADQATQQSRPSVSVSASVLPPARGTDDVGKTAKASVKLGDAEVVKVEKSVALAKMVEVHRDLSQRISTMQSELEKFLSVRPTLPPQYAWSLIPSSQQNGSFRMLLGLEECVRELEAQRLRAEGVVIADDDVPLSDTFKPSCEHCLTDHAPFWRSFTSDRQEMVVVCENCDWMRVKLPFVQQYGVILREVMARAEEQEQELDMLRTQCEELEQQILAHLREVRNNR